MRISTYRSKWQVQRLQILAHHRQQSSPLFSHLFNHLKTLKSEAGIRSLSRPRIAETLSTRINLGWRSSPSLFSRSIRSWAFLTPSSTRNQAGIILCHLNLASHLNLAHLSLCPLLCQWRLPGPRLYSTLQRWFKPTIYLTSSQWLTTSTTRSR